MVTKIASHVGCANKESASFQIKEITDDRFEPWIVAKLTFLNDAKIPTRPPSKMYSEER